MSTHSLLDVIWRRRLMVVACVVGAAVAALLLSATLEKHYTASASLLIVPSGNSASFDATQAAQVTARTYSDVLSSPNFARLVAKQLGGGSPDAIAGSVQIEPIPETQLLQIRATGTTPKRAQDIANAYATAFLPYQARTLAPTTKASVSLADAAPRPTAPSRPRPLLNVLLACLLGLPFGIALAVLRERLDTRLNSVEELSARFGLPLLARVPLRKRSDASSGAFTEGFRMLRTMIRFAAGGKTPRSIAITSASEGEGKTTTALALAMAALEAGQKVLVVEADPYRPRLMRLLDQEGDSHLEHKEPGLSDYLAGASTLPRVINPTAFPNLSAIPAGPMPPSMSGLLEGRRGRDLSSKLSEEADLVILDCPPIGLSADAALLAANAEAVAFVLDLKISNGRALEESLSRLRSASANVLGVVVNRDSSHPAGEYAYYAERHRGEPRPLAALPDEEPAASAEDDAAEAPVRPRRRATRRTPAS
jgi:succinoglycan biosynthesis transport protein ExoP